MSGGREAPLWATYGCGGDPIDDDIADDWCTDYHCAGDCGLRGHGYQHAGHEMTEKSKGGRPPPPPGLRRVNVPLRLPEWLVLWMAEQPETPAELIEAALLKAHKLRPPRAP